LELLSIILKPDIIKRNPDLLKSADVYVKGKVFGELKNQSPQYDISFGLRNLDLQLPRNLGAFENIGFDGSFVSGSKPDYSEAQLQIKDLQGKLAGGNLEGEFSLMNFVDPHIKYNLNAELMLDGYDEIFNLNFLRKLSGSVSLHANFDGLLKHFKQHALDSSRSSGVSLNDLSFIVVQTNQKVSNLSGKIENRNNQATIQKLSFTYGKNDVQINATIENLMHYFFTRDTVLIASGRLQSKQLFTNDFIFDTLNSAYIQDRISNLSFNFKSTLTGNDTLGMPDIAFDIQNLTANLDKLPDLKLVNASGKFSKPDSVLKLDLREFHETLQNGKIDITGDLNIPQKRLWEFNARVNADKFPWNYVQDLAAEIQSDKEPVAKNLPVKEMELVQADLDLSASIITYPFDFNKLDIRKSKVNFTHSDSRTFSVDNIDIALENLRFKHPPNSGSLTGLKSTWGVMALKQLKVPGLNALDINLNIIGKNDSLDIEFSSASQVARSEKGNLFMDISKKERAYKLQYTVKDASLEYFMDKFYKKKFMKGLIDYSLDLHSTGETWPILKKNMAGKIEISGDSIYLSGVDIDKVLRKFERSQNFNLTDVGAVLIAGPVGLAVTKGSDFVSLATVNLNPKHQTFIRELNTKWKLEDRQLISEDVAFATLQNRVAFSGRIDFARDSIPGLTIAVVDKNGCSLMDQKLYGKTNNLKTGKLNITKTLFGSVVNFVNVIVGKDCKPVYSGKVKAPIQ
jgi:AsmA protein